MKKITKRLKRFTVLTLLIATVISSIPLASALAANNKKSSTTTNDELIDKREMYSKHFQNEDGTITAVNYNDPVHYLDDNGNWKDIDNSLVESNKGIKKAASLDNNEVNQFYTNKENPYANFMFNKKTSETDLIKINVDGYEIAWGLSNLNEVNGTLLNNTETSDKYNLTNLKSGIVYENALENADLYYYITSNNVKEEIILNEKTNIKELVYNVRTTLKPVATDTSMVVFLDENDEVVFAFQAPYMYDSAEKSSMTYETSVKVEKTKDGYKLIYTLDTDWLNSDERVYPIVIDPTVTNGRNQTTVLDTYVHPNDAVNHYHVNEDRLWVGKVNTTSRAFINWGSMPSIPSTANITDAYVSFNLFKGTSTWGKLSLYQINSNWDSTKLTWAIHNNLSYTQLLTNLTPTLRDGYYNYKLTVTNTVKKWYNNSLGKYGFMIRYTDESYNDYNTIVSSDSGTNNNYWPCIYITYSVPTQTTTYGQLNWNLPVDSKYHLSCQKFGGSHYALDISDGGIKGAPVYAVENGVIDYVEYGNASAGNWVVLKTNSTDYQNSNSIRVGYMHLDSIKSGITKGKSVTKGTVLGYVGKTGNASGYHLHFEVFSPAKITGPMNAGAYPNYARNPELFYPNHPYTKVSC